MTRSVLLALETSTEMMSVAALAFDAGATHLDDAVLAVRRVRTGAASSMHVLPAVRAVLEESGTHRADCIGIAFGAGPGSFTGLRTAAGLAQGLAFGLGQPVLPVSTLEACAQAARAGHPDVTRVLAALDARMGEVYWAEFEWRSGMWHAVRAPCLGVPQDVVASARPYVLAGSASEAFGAALAAVSGAERVDGDALPDAAHIAALGWQRWHGGQALTPAQAVPEYLRDKVAQTTAERTAARLLKDTRAAAGAG